MTPTTATAKFDLDTSALVPGSATTLELTAATSSDVLAAVRDNDRFPGRQIDLAGVGLSLNGAEIDFSGAGGKISIAASATADLQLGIFDKGREVLDRLSLEDADEIALALPDDPESRYALFLAGYSAQGKISGSHPIGVVGSVSFGVEGRRQRRYAVVHRFLASDGAHDVLNEVFSSIKLPRHVSTAAQLSPSTLVITEVDGSIALKMSTQLGYDFNFVREARGLGLQGDVGLRIEAGARSAIGLQVSGRYLLVMERPSAAHLLRLRLFKLRKKAFDFGLNLSARAEAVVDILPERADDLVKAVFGVHGQQIIKDLKLIERWTDPDTDLSSVVAGLVNEAGFELLERSTGLDARSKFNEARAVLLGAIEKWEALPSAVSAVLWTELEGGGLSGARRDLFEASLKLLAGDPAMRKAELSRLLTKAGLENDLIGRFLIAAGDRGLAALLDRSEELRQIAAGTLEILNGRVIERLQAFITERLNLDQIIEAISATDFDELDRWLVQRLSSFLDREFRFENLDEMKNAIHLVLRKRQEIYAKARQALARRYEFDLAVRYQSSSSTSALLDATFDTSEAASRALLESIVVRSNLDDLLTIPTSGVSLGKAVLTHEITRQSSVEVHFPYYDSRTTTFTESLARVSAHEDGGRVLFYELSAENTITKNAFKSQLALSASLLSRPGGEVRMHRTRSNATWSYRFQQIFPNLRRKELEERIEPLILEYFPRHFPGGTASLSGFLTDFDRSVEEVVQNGTDEFGDLLLSLDVSVPGHVIASWFDPRTKQQARAAAGAASIRIQRSLQRLLSFYFFRNLDNLQPSPTSSPLLVFAALPALNDFRIEGGKSLPAAGPIWDVFDRSKRAFVVNSRQTLGRLGSILAAQQARLIAAGRNSQAAFFDPSEVRDFITGVADHPNFVSLLRLTSVAVHGVEEALNDLREFDENIGTRPSKAIERLAEFGAEIVSTFNKELSSIYGSELLRPLGSLVFVESSCALNADATAVQPNAILSMTVLKERREYRMETFLANQLPPADEVAIQQRLVS